MATTVIRVNQDAHAKLKAWADQEAVSIGSVIEEMIEERERQLAYEEIRQAYRRLQEDPEAWGEYLAEQKDMQAMASDSLRHEPPYEPVHRSCDQ